MTMASIPLLVTKLLQQWQLTAIATLTLLLALSVVSLFLLGRRGGSSNKLKLPPAPARLPVLGNLHQLGPVPHRSLRELARRHGPVMLLRLGKATAAVVVSSAEAARDVLRTHDVDCCSRPVSPGTTRLSYGFKNIAFSPYGEYWREMRKIFAVELVSARRVKAAWRARRDQMEILVRNLTRAETKPVALDDHIFGLADGIIGAVAFGNIYGTEGFTHRKHFQHVLDDAMDMMASFSTENFFLNAAGRLVDRLTGLVARRERIFHDLDAFFEMVIEQHLDPARAVAPENGGDLVDALIGLWKQGHHGTIRFSRDHVKAILLDAFLGGIDTSSVTMVWAMSELIRAPRVMTKVQDEIRAVVVGDDRVQPDDLPRLKYLKTVVKETLRLHPPATLLLPRETVRDVTIGGYDVLARTRVFVNAWAIGRDPASWDEPEVFDPGRFEHKEVDFNGAYLELVPFGAGRRICPGLAMGAATVEFTLANLLQCFDWALPEGVAPETVSMEEAGGLTFHRKTPLVLVPSVYRKPATCA